MYDPHYEVKTGLELAYASGTADRTGTGIDTQGFGGIRFVVTFAAIAGGGANSIKAQQSDDDASTDAYSDLEGTAQTVADDDDNTVRTITIVRPQKRYVRLYVDKDTSNACAETAIYELFDPKSVPVSVASLEGAEHFVSPSEGTA